MAHFRLQTRNSVVWPFPFSQPICAEALVWCLDEWIMCFPRWQASLGKLMSTYWAREGEFHSLFLCTLEGLELLFAGHAGVASRRWLMGAASSVIGSATRSRGEATVLLSSGLSFMSADCRCHPEFGNSRNLIISWWMNWFLHACSLEPGTTKLKKKTKQT